MEGRGQGGWECKWEQGGLGGAFLGDEEEGGWMWIAECGELRVDG